MGGFANSQQAYTENTGLTTTNSAWVDQRDPTQFDVNYVIGQFWQNQRDVKLWYLNRKSNFSGQLLATWELISVNSALVSLSDTVNTVVFPSTPFATPPDNIQLVGGTGISVVATPGSNLLTISSTGAGAETLTGDDGVAVAPIAGTIQTLGNTVANATFPKPLYTNNPSTNIEQWNLQVAAAIASTNINLAGIASFSNAQFAVDSKGFVTLIGGGGAPTLGLTPDATSGGGTSPVIPNGSGDIIVTSAANFATGTQANSIRTISTAAHTLAIQAQLAGSHAATATANDFGVAQFDANQFVVIAGFVQLIGGGTTGAVTSLTGNDAVQVFPLAGNINVLGTGSLTTIGTANTETISLTGLTNHAVLVGAGTATITKIAATATTGAVLQNNAGADPSYSTASYPSTTTINDILYSTANNVVGQLAAANSSVLGSSAAGVPTWLGPLTDGQIIIGSTGAIPVAATLTAGSGISITNGAGTITIAAVGGAGVVSTLTGNSGGAISPVAGNINTLGTGSITIIGSGNTLTTQLTGLTNHAVQVGAGTATLTQVGPSASTGQVLQNNAGADPSYSTATYPSTTTINQLLYSSANNVVSGLSTANSAVLITSATGVPQLSSSLTSGELIIGSTGALPVTATLTAGPGVSIVNGAGSITISATSSSLVTYTNVNHAASPYTVLVTDQYISCDTTAGTVILLFPNAPTSFKTWIVKDRLGTASTSNISITTVGGGDTIDGLTTYKIIGNYGAVQLLFNSTGYEVF